MTYIADVRQTIVLLAELVESSLRLAESERASRHCTAQDVAYTLRGAESSAMEAFRVAGSLA